MKTSFVSTYKAHTYKCNFIKALVIVKISLMEKVTKVSLVHCSDKAREESSSVNY